MPRGFLLGVGIVGGMLWPGPAEAGSDFQAEGSFAMTAAAEDNLFFTPGDGVADRITRFTPSFRAGWRSPRLSLTARYLLDAERYADHPELDTSRARDNAVIELTALPARGVTLAVRGDYATTLTPGDFNLATGIASVRTPARRWSAGPALEWRIGTATTGRAAWSLSRDEVAGGAGATTRIARLELERRLSPRDTGRLAYTHGRYDFEAGGLTVAHTFAFGWDRSLGPNAGLTLQAGPRFSDGHADPEISVALRGGARRVHLALTGSRTLATVIGRANPVVTDSLLPALAFHPHRTLHLRVAPEFFRIRDARGGATARVRVLGLEVEWRPGRRLSFLGSWRRSLQEGSLDPAPAGAAPGAGEIARRTVILALVARAGEGRPPAGGEPPEGRP